MIQPWWRAQNRAWYAELGGRQYLLCHAPSRRDRPGREAASRELARLVLAAGQPTSERPTVAAVVAAFRAWLTANRAPATAAWYSGYLADWLGGLDAAYVDELRPRHVAAWLAGHPGWGPASRRAAIRAVQRALAWAAKERRIAADPLAGLLEKPAPTRREHLVTAADYMLMAAASDRPFGRVLTALWETGCRPIEVRTVTAAECVWSIGAWVFPIGHPAAKSSRKTQRPRVTYLTPRLLSLCRALAAERPEGPLFANCRGWPWKRAAIKDRFRRLRDRLDLPAGTVAYAFRHSFATDAIAERGLDVATVAELMGHADLGMFARHYGHLTARGAHLRDAARRARGG